MSPRTHFVLRRLHSLSGALPLGVFLVEHLLTNARALYGRGAFTRAVGDIQGLPLLPWLELAFIALPLAFHALYGVVIAAQGSANVDRYPYARNWLYVLQRASGVMALAFLALHVWQYRAQKLLRALAWENFYYQLTVDLNRPAVFAAYVLGVSATVFHFANGLWLFGNTWGITVTTRSMRRAAWGCAALGAVLWIVGIDTLLHFALHCGGVIPLPGQSAVGECVP